MLSTVKIKRMLAITLLSLLATGCSILKSHSPTFPSDLNLISLSDGGVCMDSESVRRLAEFKAELERM